MRGSKNILLGITGSIAAYKSADIARRLMEEGCTVQAVMTKAACKFITPLTLEAVTGKPVLTDLFADTYSHINASKDADVFLIAPATANIINKISCGIADDLLSTLWLTYEGNVLIAPAMNHRMYRHPVVQKHVQELRKMGVQFNGPITGKLACGEDGEGKMAEVSSVVECALSALTEKDLSGHNIIVTAGPTLEPIDPVRFLSNRSSGKMGYAIAKIALRRGAKVILISGPSAQPVPEGVTFVPVERAQEMETAVLTHLPKATALIMAAAVADFMPSEIFKVKLQKSSFNSLKLSKTSDILKKAGAIKGKRILIGFAAETGADIDKAKKKLKDKNLDIIVLNDVTQEGAGFGVDTNIITLIDRKSSITTHPLMKKIEAAKVILDRLKGV